MLSKRARASLVVARAHSSSNLGIGVHVSAFQPGNQAPVVKALTSALPGVIGVIGVIVVILDAFVGGCLELPHTIHLTNHFNFPISQWGQKIHCVTGSQANLEEAIVRRPPGQSIYPDGAKTPKNMP